MPLLFIPTIWVISPAWNHLLLLKPSIWAMLLLFFLWFLIIHWFFTVHQLDKKINALCSKRPPDSSWHDGFCHICNLLHTTTDYTPVHPSKAPLLLNNTVCAGLRTGHPGTNPEKCVKLKYVLRYSTPEQSEGEGLGWRLGGCWHTCLTVGAHRAAWNIGRSSIFHQIQWQ